ncbi:hypothetical protein NN561_008585 [Cricetulus griseus]
MERGGERRDEDNANARGAQHVPEGPQPLHSGGWDSRPTRRGCSCELSGGVLFVGDTRVAVGTVTPGEGVLRMNRSPARGLEQDISGNNAVVVRKRECSRIATASYAARISGGCEVCNLE